MSESPYGPWLPTDISPSKLKMFLECGQKWKYRYIDRLPSPSGGASLQGSSLHEVFLEEYCVGGIQQIDALIELLEMDLQHRLDTEDPRDYKSGLPLTDAEKWELLEQVKKWGRGLFETVTNGEDHYGNKFSMPKVKETEIEGCIEVPLPSGPVVRLRGYIDMLYEDGSIGDLKLASDYFKAIWTLAKAITEQQPAMYCRMMGTDTFRYLIVDKKKDRTGPNEPVVRTIDFKVGERQQEILIQQLEKFVRVTDVLNNYENGIFEPNPEYNGQTKATAGLTSANFCGKLCDYKAQCWKDNYEPGEDQFID